MAALFDFLNSSPGFRRFAGLDSAWAPHFPTVWTPSQGSCSRLREDIRPAIIESRQGSMGKDHWRQCLGEAWCNRTTSTRCSSTCYPSQPWDCISSGTTAEAHSAAQEWMEGKAVGQGWWLETQTMEQMAALWSQEGQREGKRSQDQYGAKGLQAQGLRQCWSSWKATLFRVQPQEMLPGVRWSPMQSRLAPLLEERMSCLSSRGRTWQW